VKAKRMGRPPLAKKERKAAHLSVRLTEAEHRAAERAAKTVGLGLSEWARSLVLAASSASSGGAGTQRTPPS
jgi:prolyl-tRNA editing enzyme YbaK/EbsC (Cys-tRNA(Pro) deacylase)